MEIKMMRTGSLGRYKRTGDFHQFELYGEDLRSLARLVSSLTVDDGPLRVQIGQGCIQFENGSPGSFTARLSSEGTVLVSADPQYLVDLAKEFAQMADDPYDFVHLHLDVYFSRPGEQVSDIVVQRIESE
jgi:hypothetical protein